MSRSYYIYYRIDPSRTAAAQQRIDRLLDAVKAGTGISGRVLKKCREPNLWMEVYENVADEAEFERAMAGAVDAINAAEFLQSGGARHIECFEG